MALDTVATDHFRNRRNAPNTYSSVFGGQLVAQALAASDLTVSDRTIHSLHSYFLRSGRVEAPLDFTVERVRDGRSLSVRRVIVSQDAQPIFSMDCSYRVAMDGVRHQRAPSAAFIADDAIDPTLDQSGHPFLTEFLKRQPVNVRFAERRGFLCQGLEPKRHYWLKVPGIASVDDAAVHRQVFAYLSDLLLSGAPLVPHTQPLPGPHLFVASLDHSIWFHRPIRCDDWLQFETESPSACNGINLTQAWVYDRSGALVASVAQEAMQFVTDDAAC